MPSNCLPLLPFILTPSAAFCPFCDVVLDAAQGTYIQASSPREVRLGVGWGKRLDPGLLPQATCPPHLWLGSACPLSGCLPVLSVWLLACGLEVLARVQEAQDSRKPWAGAAPGLLSFCGAGQGGGRAAGEWLTSSSWRLLEQVSLWRCLLPLRPWGPAETNFSIVPLPASQLVHVVGSYTLV